MAQVFTQTVVFPDDGPTVLLSDQGPLGCTLSVELNRGDSGSSKILWNTGGNDGPRDTVDSFVQWLDMLAAEAKLAASHWLNGVGEGPF